jgi:hypothetical protein
MTEAKHLISGCPLGAHPNDQVARCAMLLLCSWICDIFFENMILVQVILATFVPLTFFIFAVRSSKLVWKRGMLIKW